MTPPSKLRLRAAAVALMLAAVADGSAATSDERLCRSMAQRLERMAVQARTTPQALADAQARYGQRCEGEAAAPAPELTAQVAPVSSPTTGFARARTEGSFATWNATLDSECRQRPAFGNAAERRTECAQLKIDRAVQERRLDRTEVEACVPPEGLQQGPSGRPAASRQADRQVARFASLGGSAYWAWDAPGGCALAQRVRKTFAASDTTTARAGGDDPAAQARAQAQMCELDPRLPFCAATPALQLPASDDLYWRWQHQVYSRCTAQAQPGQARDFCARSVVDQALAQRRVAPAAVESCRAQWQGGPRSEPEAMAIDQCLVAAALLEQASTSAYTRPPQRRAAPQWAPQGLNRPDIVEALYSGDLSRMPDAAEDGRYALTTFGRLNAACPTLGLSATGVRIAQRMAAETQASAQRALSGRGNLSDLATVLWGANEMLKTLPDCDRWHDDESRRAACVAEKESAFRIDPSRPAAEDVSRLLRQHACTSPQIRRYAEQLSAWLLQPSAARSAMAWARGHPESAALDRMFENCRQQAGDGAADAWCGCYVRGWAGTRSSRMSPAVVLDAAARSAFVGDPQAWHTPADTESCEPHRRTINLWRRDRAVQRPAVVTACLVQQAPAHTILAPDLQSCRYRSAGGELELRARQCAPQLEARHWGGEAVACEGNRR